MIMFIVKIVLAISTLIAIIFVLFCITIIYAFIRSVLTSIFSSVSGVFQADQKMETISEDKDQEKVNSDDITAD